jgi:Abnormal spindle-like microcephaly-assoc'd, ASPM-SPD-2-Hydin
MENFALWKRGRVAAAVSSFHPNFSGLALLGALLAWSLIAGGCAMPGSPRGNQDTTLVGVVEVTPSPVKFGDVVLGTTDSQTVKVTNAGRGELTVGRVVASGTGVSVTGPSFPFTLSVGESVNFTAKFKPTAVGSDSGNISVVSSAGSAPFVVNWSGTAVAAVRQLSISTASLSFGNVSDGSSKTEDMKLENSGNAEITISGVSVTGTGFAESGAATGTTLTPGQSTTLSVSFRPQSAGSVSGRISVASNATNSPAGISLSGTGVKEAVAAHSVSLSWTESTSGGLVGYNVYRGTELGAYSRLTASPVSETSYTDSTVRSGADITYYYVVTAVKSGGEESIDSAPAKVNVP